MTTFLRHYPAGFGVAALLAGCGSDPTVIDDTCLIDPAPISARTTVIGVGDTVTFTARLGQPAECLPAGVEPPDWRWSSEDTLIAKIDSLSGLAEGESAGLVIIHVKHAREPSVNSLKALRVEAP